MARPSHRLPTIDGSLGTPIYEASPECSMKSAPEVGIGVQMQLTMAQIVAISDFAVEHGGTMVEIQQTWTESGGRHTYLTEPALYQVSRDGRISDLLVEPA